MADWNNPVNTSLYTDGDADDQRPRQCRDHDAGHGQHAVEPAERRDAVQHLDLPVREAVGRRVLYAGDLDRRWRHQAPRRPPAPAPISGWAWWRRRMSCPSPGAARRRPMRPARAAISASARWRRRTSMRCGSPAAPSRASPRSVSPSAAPARRRRRAFAPISAWAASPLLSAISVNEIYDGHITNAKLQDGAVTANKIADGHVTDAKIAPGLNGKGTRTVSTSTPTGGANGDIWYQV